MATQDRVTRRRFLGRTATIGTTGLLAPHAMAGLARAAGQNPAGGGYRVGIYTRPWDKHDYRVALDAIAEAGFKHAGLMTTTTEGRRLVIQADTSLEACEKIGREVKDRGMSIPSAYGGGIGVGKSLEQGIEDLKRLIDNCVAAGVRSLLMGGTNEKLFDVYYKAIAECCDYAAEKNVPITVKPHGGLNDTGPQCRKCIEKVGQKSFSLWYDPGNIFYYSDGKLDPVDDAATVDGLVRAGMCIKDFTMSTEEGKVKKDVWVTPGTGMVDFPAVMARLKKGGFTAGDLVIECVNRPDPNDLPAMLAEAKKAREFVEQLIAG
ncbi:MAG TPA: sugar phosphate isomerase/epimerase family protein [Thermoguttaceae bacterium]|nr:sugar phosphate isomerase/epimerase family protein [Thermoguttaceae bacterium]